MTTPLRSLLPWIGGKYYSAQCILAAFPRLQATMSMSNRLAQFRCRLVQWFIPLWFSCAQHPLQWEHLQPRPRSILNAMPGMSMKS
jgi:hypothetical protein